MVPISRRGFLKALGVQASMAGALASRVAALRAAPPGLPIGSQTWPHRALIKSGNFAGLLDTLSGIGVQAIELCSPIDSEEFASLSDGKQVRKIVADHGLRCESAHFGMDELRSRQAQSIAWAHDAGITHMVTATLGGPKTPTMDDVKRAADEYNRIAAAATREGMQQGLHNEDFESARVDGRPTYDLLLDLLDPALVKFQFQMSTISQGFVAHEYFTRYPGRFNSMHVQDVDLGTAGSAVSGRREGRVAQVALGKGSIDWARTFQAARTGGVTSYFVEQNMALTKQSVAYLKTLNV